MPRRLARRPDYAPSKIWISLPASWELSAISFSIPMSPMPSCGQLYSKPCRGRNSNQLSTRSIRSFVHLTTCTYQELQKSWGRIRRILPPFLKAVHFGSTPAGQAIADALEPLASQGKLSKLEAVHPEIVTRRWRGYVFDKDGVADKKAYVFCCLDRLRSALRRRDLFMAPSIRYTDARIGLLIGAAWENSRSTICRSLGHSLSADETIAKLSHQLDQTYRAVAANLPANPSARVEMSDGKEDLVLTALDNLRMAF